MASTGIKVGEHRAIITRPVYRVRIESTRRHRDTVLAKREDGQHYAVADTAHADPLPVTLYRSRTRYRDVDGVVRDVQAEGPSKAAAERSLRRKLTERGTLTRSDGELTPSSTVAQLWQAHLAHLGSRGRATRTLDTYERLWAKIDAILGSLRLEEVTTGRLQRCIDQIERDSGPTTAKMARALLMTMWDTARRADAADRNLVGPTLVPVIEVATTSAPTAEQVMAILQALRTSGTPVPPLPGAKQTPTTPVSEHCHRLAADLADPVVFMAGTGCRISEVLGLRWIDLDLAASTASVAGRAIWVKGDGMAWQAGAKSVAGSRTIALPRFVLAMLLERQVQNPRPSEYVFPSEAGTLRDSNTFRKGWRRVRPVLGADGINPHDFRRGLATVLYDAGLAHQVADVLGHSSPAVAEAH